MNAHAAARADMEGFVIELFFLDVEGALALGAHAFYEDLSVEFNVFVLVAAGAASAMTGAARATGTARAAGAAGAA